MGLVLCLLLVEGELRAPRASLSATRLVALGICRILKEGKRHLLRRNSSICVVKAGHSSGENIIFTNWEQSVAKTTSEKSRVVMHCIAHIKASHSACRADKFLRRFIAPIIFSSDPTSLQNHPCPVNLSFSFQAPSIKQIFDCPDACHSKFCGPKTYLSGSVVWASAHTSLSTSTYLSISWGFPSLLLKTLLFLFFQMYHIIHGKLLKSCSFGNL